MAAGKKSAQLSEYERARQEKIAKNQALLQQLQLDAQQTGIGPKSKPKPSSTAGQKRKKPAPKAKVEEGPRRTSSRLKGIVADSEVARQKQEDDHEAFQEQQRIKRQRVSEDIDLHNTIVNGQNWNRAGNWLSMVGPADPGVRTFDKTDIKDTTDKELKALRERMSNLQLWEGAEPNRIKITPERIYALGFHPAQDKALVFAGDKLGNMGLFDASQTTPEKIKQEADDADEDGDVDDEVEPAITTFKIHTRTISAFQFSPHDHNALYSASYDSSIRKLDLTKGVAVESYAPEDRSADEPLSGVQISHADPNTLHFTTLSGAFGIKDMRTPKNQVTMLQLCEKKIGGFSLHPAHPHLVATASLDRTLKIWDLRKITGKKDDRLPVLVGEHTSKLSVSHAAFNSAGQVATASYDDTVKIYDFPSCGDWKVGTTLDDNEMSPATIVPHNNQTGRWVTILRAQWQLQPQDGIQRFCIGNMNRFVDIYTGKGQQLAQLGGENITAVPSVAQFHPTMDWVGAGTASGKLCLWM
ncbi:DNA damage-binding protein CMR1 [Fulvia fulva]|uniref:DNA damage-binding protein CMR1 n=1 Tax=Passalora fulva TaxID=5499 RepID=A0A9Q8PH22_PASFU|nr:DNA damage-binding protein CMR1 [Fulvia fulva]UJO22318.1 DNA damage-binding protein CMR1 [Fulvia fulva]